MNNDQNNNMLTSKLLELLSNVDKEKLNQVSRMVQNMSSKDMSNIMGIINNMNKEK